MKKNRLIIIVGLIASIIISGGLGVALKSICPLQSSYSSIPQTNIVPEKITPGDNLIPSAKPFDLSYRPLHMINPQYRAGFYKHHELTWTTSKINSKNDMRMITEVSLHGNILKTSKYYITKNEEIPSFQLTYADRYLLYYPSDINSPFTFTNLFKIPIYKIDDKGKILKQIDWAGIYVTFVIHITANTFYMDFSATCKDFYQSNHSKGNIISGLSNLTHPGNYNERIHLFW